jgi:hypothetical protein
MGQRSQISARVDQLGWMERAPARRSFDAALLAAARLRAFHFDPQQVNRPISRLSVANDRRHHLTGGGEGLACNVSPDVTGWDLGGGNSRRG